MSDEIKQVEPEKIIPTESKAMSVSIRGWLTLIVVVTVCGMEVFKIGISEPLYSMTLIIVGFYFGQNKPPTPVKTP